VPAAYDHFVAVHARHAGALVLLGGWVLIAGGCAGERAQGRPWVRDVRFVGVQSIDRKDLATKLAVERSGWLRCRKKFLDPRAVEIDRRRIEAYYRAHGFFDAEVVAANVLPRRGPRDRPTAVDVEFVVEEGLPTRIAAVELAGLEAVDERARLERELREALPVGAVFDHETYLASRDALAGALERLGHAWPVVDGRVELDRDRRAARVIVNVDAGPIARLAGVRFEGLERVSERALARHLALRPGARFSPEALERARASLYYLGLFSSVRVEPAPVEDDPAAAAVLVRVQEGSRNELRLGAGVGLESQRASIEGSLVYTRRNFFGGLRTFRLRIDPGWVAIPAFWNIDRTGPLLISEAGVTQPDWPCRRCALGLEVGFDVGVEYAYQYLGPRVTLSLQRDFWRDRVHVGASWNFQFLDFLATDPAVLLDPAQSGLRFGYTNPYRIGWWQQNVALELRDRPLAAHRGAYFALSFEEGGADAGGAFRYQKVTPDVRAYAPLGRYVTLAGRVELGQIFTEGELGSPTTRRFYLGGASSHRGFNFDRLSPQVPSGISGAPPLPIGGDQMFLFQLELRADVLPLFGEWLSCAAFLDAGDVGAPDCGSQCGPFIHQGGVDWRTLNYAVGGGLRYRTVVGTVRFDVGVRLNRLTPFEPDGTPNADPGERVAFHLSIGEAF
jgi:translocation and assembly module TamA